MLEQPKEQAPPLSKRDPKKTLFVLLTPRMFVENENWRSRLYGRLMHEYKDDPAGQRLAPSRGWARLRSGFKAAWLDHMGRLQLDPAGRVFLAEKVSITLFGTR